MESVLFVSTYLAQKLLFLIYYVTKVGRRYVNEPPDSDQDLMRPFLPFLNTNLLCLLHSHTFNCLLTGTHPYTHRI